jgi:Lactate racemase N-terminal domain
MKLPKMLNITQQFDVDEIKDIQQETLIQIKHSGVLDKIETGMQVAIGIGSRGIVNQLEVVTTVCRAIEQVGGVPFIFPAMGSHGGATSEGQRDVLKSLGFDEQRIGVKIRSESKGVRVGETDDGIPLYVDKYALEADFVVLINRIKPHTKFKGAVESGIAKMMTVGMGKVQGAEVMHRAAVKFGFPHVIQTSADKIVPLVSFLFAVAIIETPFKSIHSISVITPETMIKEEELLKQASQTMAKIPLDGIDLLIIDEIGKDVSGTGMDTNVIGRNRDILGSFTTPPNVMRIFVRDLTPATQGNANGIGFADFTTRRLVDKLDFKKTYKNALTAMSPEKAAIPVTLENDREAIETALDSIGLISGQHAKVVRIKNTSMLTQFQISEALLKSLPSTGIKIIGHPEPMQFDNNGNLSTA